jgi:DNA-binding transcriptional MocR family regulator
MLEKWGKPVAERGFAQVPNYLLLLNQFLDDEHRLSPVELLVLIQLVGTWWKKGDKPFPSMATLARRCGSSERQIQRAVNQLVAVGLIAKEKRRVGRGLISSNAYDLTPLTGVLDEAAKAYPNDYPRKVDPEVTRRITARLKKGEISTEQLPEAKAEGQQPSPVRRPRQKPISA